MKISVVAVVFQFAALHCCAQIHHDPLSMVSVANVELTDSFWLPKIKTIQNTTIPFAFEKCRQEGRMENFLIAGHKAPGPVRGKMPFDDTDLYKIIEGASTSLISSPNPLLDAYIDSVIDIVKIGQEPDGYITTWFTIDPNHPPAPWVTVTGKRWTGEVSSHELYNSGHLFEAAAAHYTATGKRNLLDIALRNADLLVEKFGPGKLTIPPGHQIVETGLVKLYAITGNEKYLTLAKFFLDLRGDSTTHALYGEYSQDHIPVTRQTEIVGHAVRAVYMYAGMTDIGALCNEPAYLDALKKIWTNMVERKMYLTGGIGAKHEGESLGKDYELPNLTSYSETCASIGDIYWNTRLFMLSGEKKYFDVIERTLYNGVIAGLSLDGKKFFYVNPLEADGKFLFNQGDATRQAWFDCSCCPTNLIRFIPSVPGLFYAVQKDTLYVNLYASNTATATVGEVKTTIDETTGFPWSGDVCIVVRPERPSVFTMKFRIPGWTENSVLPGGLYSYHERFETNVLTILVNGEPFKPPQTDGYLTVTRRWHPGDIVSFEFPMFVRRVMADAKVRADENLIALERGPFVYCIEGIDHDNRIADVVVPDDAHIQAERRNFFPGGLTVLEGDIPVLAGSSLRKFVAIPYYAWSNRGAGTMKVWLPVK